MKTRSEIEQILKKNKPYLIKKFKVSKIGFFGSYARNEQSKASDIDILVNFSSPIGWEFVDLKEYLEDILELNVDLVTIRALKSQLKDNILKEVVYT